MQGIAASMHAARPARRGPRVPPLAPQGREKINLIHSFTQLGFDVLISDVDTVWLRNPIPYVQQACGHPQTWGGTRRWASSANPARRAPPPPPQPGRSTPMRTSSPPATTW